MSGALKWLGFALVAIGVAVFPFAIWFPGPWGVIALVLIMIGCVLLVLALKALRETQPQETEDPWRK